MQALAGTFEEINERHTKVGDIGPTRALSNEDGIMRLMRNSP